MSQVDIVFISILNTSVPLRDGKDHPRYLCDVIPCSATRSIFHMEFYEALIWTRQASVTPDLVSNPRKVGVRHALNDSWNNLKTNSSSLSATMDDDIGLSRSTQHKRHESHEAQKAKVKEETPFFLATGGWYLIAHKSILKPHFPIVFEDTFLLDLAETYDNMPMIQLPDNDEDVPIVLRTIYERK